MIHLRILPGFALIVCLQIKQARNADNFYKFCLAAIVVQETRIKETGLLEFTSYDRKKVCLYNSGNGTRSIQGVGIITEENTNVIFNPVSEWICIITTKTSDNIKCHLISAYPQILENTVRNPDEARVFYEQLMSLKTPSNKEMPL